MNHGKVFFHVAANCGGCNGIGEMFQALDAAGTPFAVYSANDPGLLVEAARYPTATLIYRDVEASTVNPIDYDDAPDKMAAVYWKWTMMRTPDSIKALKGRVWLELLNEPGKEGAQADWVGRLMTRMALLALAEGWRVCGPGWSAGTPEPAHWQTAGWQEYLRLCAVYPLRVAVSLHEYSLDNDIHAGEAADGSKWLVGRFEHLFAACDEMKIARPVVFITEAGWTLNSMPAAEQAKRDIQYLSQLYAAHPQIQAAFLWTLQAGQGNGDLPQRLNALMPWLTQYVIQPEPPLAGEPPPQTTGPEPQPPTVPVPPVPPMNRLNNGDFEGGWHHPDGIPELQLPAGSVKWRDGNDPGWANPFDTAAHARFVRPEIRTLPAAQLPPAEQPLFVRDGAYTVKAFKGGGAWYATFMQTVELPAGKWRLVTPVFADLVAGYDAGKKVFSTDPNAGLWRARVGPVVVSGYPSDGPFGGGWVRLAAGQWNEPAAEFETKAAGPVEVKIDFLLPFPLRQNGIFTDAWSLAAVGATTPQPEPPPPARPIKVVDISQWQGAIDGARMKAAGVDGVMVRAGYGGVNGSAEDERVDAHVAALRAAGIPWGFYWYFHPARGYEEQFTVFERVVKRHGYALPLALDLEETAGLNAVTTLRATLFAGLMSAEFPGRRHMIYTSLGYWRDKLGSPAWGADFDLWIAAWTDAARPIIPSPWRDWTLWQYTSSGDGAAHGASSARIDLNRFNGPSATFAGWAAAAPPPPPPTTPSPTPPATAIWNDAAARPIHSWLPNNALAKTILGHSLIPVSDEYRLEHGGKTWVYQIARSGDLSTRRVYYAEMGKWGDVKWNAGPATTPPAPAGKIDLLPYLEGDGRLYEVRHVNAAGVSSQERFQTQTAAGNVFYQTKNAAWEEFRYDGAYIWRGMDTSPGPDNGRDRFYIQAETALRHARWCPRYMAVGEAWVGPGHRVQFQDKATCAKLAAYSGAATNRITLVARHAARVWNGVTVNDVVELTNGTETWWFGKNFGLVAWKSKWGESAIAEVHQPGARPDNVREVIPCLP